MKPKTKREPKPKKTDDQIADGLLSKSLQLKDASQRLQQEADVMASHGRHAVKLLRRCHAKQEELEKLKHKLEKTYGIIL